MDKEDVYIYHRILLFHKKNEILPFSTRMDLKGIMISKNVRQTKTNTMCVDITVKSKEENYREWNLGCQRREVYAES